MVSPLYFPRYISRSSLSVSVDSLIHTFLVNFLSHLSISIYPSYFSQYISFLSIFLNVSFVLSSESLYLSYLYLSIAFVLSSESLFLSYLSQFILLSLTLLPSSMHSSLLSSKHVLELYCL